MKKFLAIVLAMGMVLSLAACGSSSDDESEDTSEEESSTEETEEDTEDSEDTEESEESDEESDEEESESSSGIAAEDLLIGLICIGDEQSAYDYAHIDGAQSALEALGLSEDQLIVKVNIAEGQDSYDAAVDLAEQGCQLIISDSYGHEPYMIQAATEYPDIIFISDAGDQANHSGLDNFLNAFPAAYQSRYVSGVVAGMKIAELVENGELTDANYDDDGNVKIGYVGAYPYAEVVSGFTAFFLGIQSVYEDVSMEVQYTNSWYDVTAEMEAANTLIADGCVIISQHADSTGAPQAVEAAYESGNTAVFSVGYDISMLSVAPDVALTSATNEWEVFYEHAFSCMISGEGIGNITDTDWSAGYEEGAVAITELGDACAEGTAEKVEEVEAAIIDGSLQIFDCSTFTVDGENPTSLLIDMDGDYEGDTEAVVDGVFQESLFRSAPGFTAIIDGITELNN